MDAHVSVTEMSQRNWLARFTPRRLTPGASAHLDTIRALAAWAVMWGHVRGHFFVDYQHVRERSVALKVLYFCTGFGHQAVMVFFVLSGFLISSSILQSCASGRWSWREYAINRSARLYAVLIPGLLLGLLWDKLGITFFSASGVYSHPLEDFGAAIAQNQITFPTFIGNLFFLQTILCPTFGSNGPLWSLANEFWYYILFPVALFAGIAWVTRSLRQGLLLTILAAGVMVLLGGDKLVGFLIWLAGCGLVVAYRRLQMVSKRWLTLYALISSLSLAGCLAAARLGRPGPFGSDMAVGFTFALSLFWVLHIDSGGDSEPYRGAVHFFAGFSYSLYVLHFPLVMFLRAWIAPTERWQPDWLHLLFGAGIGVVALGFAWVVSTFTENRTDALRRLMRRAVPQ